MLEGQARLAILMASSVSLGWWPDLFCLFASFAEVAVLGSDVRACDLTSVFDRACSVQRQEETLMEQLLPSWQELRTLSFLQPLALV